MMPHRAQNSYVPQVGLQNGHPGLEFITWSSRGGL